MTFKKIISVPKRAVTQFGEDKVMAQSAALAYYAMFSIGPLLVIAVGVAGLLMGKEQVRHQVQEQLQSMLGANSAKTLESMMAAQKHGTSLLDQAVFLHHRAVAIHPFPNGNGRWSRLISNIWLKLHDQPIVRWPEFPSRR